jgi:hypothetical protein
MYIFCSTPELNNVFNFWVMRGGEIEGAGEGGRECASELLFVLIFAHNGFLVHHEYTILAHSYVQLVCKMIILNSITYV